MGLLGLSSAPDVDSEWRCVVSSPGSPLAEDLYRCSRKLPPAASRVDESRSVDVYVGYLEHRELGAWSVNPRADGAAHRVLSVLATTDPRTVVLTSTRSALTVQRGFSLLALVDVLRAREYKVCWLRVSAIDQGLPHDAHYTLVVATREAGDGGGGALLSRAAGSLGYRLESAGAPLDVRRELEMRRPRLGVSRVDLGGLPSAGFLADGQIVRQHLRSAAPLLDPSKLAQCVCPDLEIPDGLRAVRLVSRSGSRGVSVKPLYASFALGPGVSARPLFAIRSERIDSRTRDVALRWCNWSIERDGWLVWRLEPGRAILLHGAEAGYWERGLRDSTASLEAKYSLLAKGCPPRILGKVVFAAMSHSRSVARARVGRRTSGECR